MMGISLIESLRGRRLPFSIEVIGFSEEEGVRFGIPLHRQPGSLLEMLTRQLSRGDSGRALGEPSPRRSATSVSTYRASLTPASRRIRSATSRFHIEQGPVLDHLHQPVAIVDRIVGRSHADVTFVGSAGHAGTTPMDARKRCADGSGGVDWLQSRHRPGTSAGLVATTGRIEAAPGAANVIPGHCRRHARCAARRRCHAQCGRRSTAVGCPGDCGTPGADRRVVAAFRSRRGGDAPGFGRDAHAGGRAHRGDGDHHVERRGARRHDSCAAHAGGDVVRSNAPGA